MAQAQNYSVLPGELPVQDTRHSASSFNEIDYGESGFTPAALLRLLNCDSDEYTYGEAEEIFSNAFNGKKSLSEDDIALILNLVTD